MHRISGIVGLCLLVQFAFGQYKWKLEKDEAGIKVFTSSSPTSSFNAVKVECTFTGTYAKLISVLTNVEKFSDWIYHNKTSKLIKKNNHYDFIYYSETRMPWPLSNRDVILHLRLRTDSLPKFLNIQGRNEENIYPSIPSKVRVPFYSANWKVTMPSPNKIHINYVLELDPGGSIPAWIANNYVDKGPFETFSNLSKQLLK